MGILSAIFGSNKQETVVESTNQNTINVDAATSINIDTTSIANGIESAIVQGSTALTAFVNSFTNGASVAANSLENGLKGGGNAVGLGLAVIGFAIVVRN